jgi:hypothetical protein
MQPDGNVAESNGATRVAYILGVPLAAEVVRQWPQMNEIVRTRDLIAEVEGNFPELTLEVGRRLHLDNVVVVEWTCNYGDGRLYRNVTIGELEGQRAPRPLLADLSGSQYPWADSEPDNPRPRSVEAAEVGGYVGGVLLQHLDRYDVERADVRRSEHHRWSDTVEMRLQPSHRHHAPPVARYQTWEAPFGSWCREIIAD